jgi:hypothetical protein
MGLAKPPFNPAKCPTIVVTVPLSAPEVALDTTAIIRTDIAAKLKILVLISSLVHLKRDCCPAGRGSVGAVLGAVWRQPV